MQNNAGNENRRPLYAKIAIARKQLPEMGDDDYFYKDFLTREFGDGLEPVESLKALSYRQLCRLVDLLAQCGAVYTTPGKERGDTPYRAKAAGRRSDFYEIPDGPLAPLKRKICKLWHLLGYEMIKLDVRVQREKQGEVFRWVQDKRYLGNLASDLEKRLSRKEKKAREAEAQRASV